MKSYTTTVMYIQSDIVRKQQIRQAVYYNITLRCVRATIVVEENNEYYTLPMCVCRLWYPA